MCVHQAILEMVLDRMDVKVSNHLDAAVEYMVDSELLVYVDSLFVGVLHDYMDSYICIAIQELLQS